MQVAIKNRLISIIIPAYMQEKTILIDIAHIKSVLDTSGYDYELLVIVDGFVDKTYEIAKRLKSKKITIYGYKHNHGKGYTIRYGMVRSKGDIVCFIDAGMDINPKGLLVLLKCFESQKADIVIGSKRHSQSIVSYPWNRKIISFFSQLFIRFLFGLNIKDTQVGMKLFKRKVLEDIMPRLLVKKFAFDIEMLVVANSLGYKKIFEAPIELNYDFNGSLMNKNLFIELFHTFWDTIAVFYRLKIREYYKDKNKRRWKYDPELEFKVNIG